MRNSRRRAAALAFGLGAVLASQAVVPITVQPAAATVSVTAVAPDGLLAWVDETGLIGANPADPTARARLAS